MCQSAVLLGLSASATLRVRVCAMFELRKPYDLYESVDLRCYGIFGCSSDASRAPFLRHPTESEHVQESARFKKRSQVTDGFHKTVRERDFENSFETWN